MAHCCRRPPRGPPRARKSGSVRGWAWPKGSRTPLEPLPGRCVLTPGTSVPVRCVCAPDLRRPKIGTRVPLPSRTVRAYLLPTPPRDRTGKYLGRRSRNWKRTLDRGRFGREIPDPDHEPSNWTSANGPGDRRGGSSHPNFIRVMVASRYRGAISLFPAVSRPGEPATSLRRSGRADPVSDGSGERYPGDRDPIGSPEPH